MLRFAFVGDAFGVRPTVAARVSCLADVKIIARLSEDIGRPKKEKKPTVRPKIVAGTAGVKKTWMIHLQQCYRHGV